MPLSLDLVKRLILEELALVLQEQQKPPQEPPSAQEPAPAALPDGTQEQQQSPITPPGPSGTEPTPGVGTGPDQASQGGTDGGMDTPGGTDGGGGDLPTGEEGAEDDLSGGGGEDMGGGFGGLGGMGGGGGGGGGSGGSDSEPGEPGEGAPGLTPPNEPEKRPDDPMGAVMDAATDVAGKTTDVQLITNAIKASIQANFKDYQEAWPLVQQLKDTKDTTLSAVADRVSLFIAGVLHEELQRTTFKEEQEKTTMVKITKEQLTTLVKEAVRKKLMAEQHSLFDTHRAQIEQERKAIESQMNSTEIREMAIDVFEKLCGKCGVPSENLSPETMEVVNKELKRMQYAIQEIANVLTQTATVLNAASPDGTTKGK